MENFLLQFKNSYVIVPIMIALGLVLTYIDSKFSQKELTTKDYITSSIFFGFIATVVVYIHNIKGSIEEEILSGPPPF